MPLQDITNLQTRARLQPMHVVFAAGMLSFVALFCFLSVQEPICIGDCDDYVILMGLRPWTRLYWRMLHHGLRSWTVPVFYSLFGHYGVRSAQLIVIAQALLLLAATIAFSAAVASHVAVQTRWLSGVLIAVMLTFQQGYLLFSSYLLSDSLSWVLVLLVLTLVISAEALIRQCGFLVFSVLYIGLSWMAAGARDANQQLVILFTAYLLGVQWLRFSRRQVLILVTGLLFICILQGHWAKLRYRINIENVLVARILPDAQARQFFVRHGMPVAYATLGESLPLQPLDAVDLVVVNKGRRRFDAIGTEYLNAAPKTYALWLIAYPLKTANVVLAYRTLIFGEDFNWLEPRHLQFASVARRISTGQQTDHRPETPSFDRLMKLLSWRPSLIERFPFWLRVALVASATAFGLLRRCRSFLVSVGGFALMITLAGALNACSGFLADAWELTEMERHAAIGNMLFNAGTLILLLWALQEAAEATSRRTQRSEA